MKSRREMIKALTKYELEFISGHPEYFDHTAGFFADGGFNSYDDDQLKKQYVLKIEEEKTND